MAKIKMTPNATGEVVKMSERRRDARPGSQAKRPSFMSATLRFRKDPHLEMHTRGG